MIVPFSHLYLGSKFRYLGSTGQNQVYVKIGHNRLEGCVASWDAKKAYGNWSDQGIFSLNDTGKDIDVEVIREF